MANLQITSTQSNNIVVTVNRGIAGVGIESISVVYNAPTYYLDFLYTDGTNELVALPAIASGVSSFNTRAGAVTLTSLDVTTALGYTPPTPTGTGATGTWTISINGNASTVTNGVYTTDTGTVTNAMLAGSIANAKLVNSAITINGSPTSLGGSINVGTVTSVSGTAPIASTGGATPSISMPQATTAQDGYLSAVDWDTFNDKTSNLGTVTSVTGTGNVNGITLTGNVTDSGSLTLGGSLSSVNLVTQTVGSLDVSTRATGILPIANGGTNASTAPTARTNLGLGTSAVLNAAVALGTATLDSGGTVPLTQLPASIKAGLVYKGTWNASTNTPTLTSSVGTANDYYVVSVAGTTNLNGTAVWAVNDLAIFNGTVWQKVSASNPTIITANSTTDALRVTQLGTGNAFVVEDSATPDATAFIIDNAGNVSTGGSLTVAGFAVVDQSDIGTAPNEIPLNQYLGNLAYQDAANIAGNVGVGGSVTATSGVINANSTTDALRITQVGTGNALLVEDSANPDATPFVIDSVGNVNIGTNSAILNGVTTILQRASSGSGSTNLTLDQFASNNKFIQFSWYGANIGSINQSSGTFIAIDSPILAFQTGGTERVRISSAGDVSFGANAVRRSNFYFESANRAITATTANLAIGVTDAMGINVGGQIGLSGKYDATADQIPFGIIKGAKENATSGNLAGYLAFGTSNSGGGFAEAMRINSTSSLLLGTTANPRSSLLMVGGNVQVKPSTNNSLEILTPNSGTGIRLFARNDAGTLNRLELQGGQVIFPLSSGADGLYFDATSGNLGVGTNSPSSKFVVSNSGAAGFEINPIGSASAPAMYSYNRTTNAYDVLTSISLDARWQVGSSPTERMRLDSAGNLGLGAVPSVWAAQIKALQVNNGTSYWAYNAGGIQIGGVYFNTFNDGAQKYINTNPAASFEWSTTDGAFKWLQAPSGTAGNAISFTQAMTLNASGKLSVGTTGAFGILNLKEGDISLEVNTDATSANFLSYNRTASLYATLGLRASDVRFLIFDVERMRIDVSGNVGIGTTANTSAILDVQSTTKGVRMPNMTTTQKNAIASPAAGLMVFDTTLSKLCVYSGAAWQTITSV